MNNTEIAVEKVFEQRMKFILIGLTGRTGSGCSTVAKILRSQVFEDLTLRKPKLYEYKDSEERKYKIIYDYMKENWTEFKIIELSNVIASFIYQESYKAFIKYLKRMIYDKCEINGFLKLVKELDTLKVEFDNIERRIKEFYTKRETLKDANELEDFISLFCISTPDLTKKLKKTLRKYSYKYLKPTDTSENTANLFTYCFQDIGNNIRASGKPYSGEFSGKSVFSIVERADDIISLYLKHANITGTKTHICIEAIRNPYEATYFADKYSPFYLFSINTENVHRRERLKHLSQIEISELDEREYPTENDGIKDQFYKQNIRMCMDLSDIFIHNPNINDESYFYLTEQIIKYIALIKHPGLITPTRTERCMQVAYNAKLNSGCLSRQVGAVVTDENYSIKSIGWNDVPEGQVPCNLRDVKTFCINKDKSSYSNYEINDREFCSFLNKVNNRIKYDKLQGRTHPYCFKDIYNTIKSTKNQVYIRSLHAEENAFLQIAKYGGQGLKGGNLFTTSSPCELCSKKAFQLGIKKIYYIQPYPGISFDHIIDFGIDKDKIPEIVLFYGAIGSAYTSLYSQRFAYKDELQLITKIKYSEIHEEP